MLSISSRLFAGVLALAAVAPVEAGVMVIFVEG